MATTQKKETISQTQEPEQLPVKAEHALIQMPEARTAGPEMDEPEEIRGKKGIEAPTNLTPIIKFEHGGQYVIGEFLGIRHEMGKNKSRLYDLRLSEDRLKRMGADKLGIPIDNGLIVSIWGSKVLDSMMDMIPKMPGDTIYVQYLEDRETARGQNPAHIFKVKVFPK